jgi:hypothetical protein
MTAPEPAGRVLEVDMRTETYIASSAPGGEGCMDWHRRQLRELEAARQAAPRPVHRGNHHPNGA